MFFKSKKSLHAQTVPPLGLSPLRMNPASGLYAMWSPSEHEPSPVGTRTLTLLNEAYALLDSVATCASIAREVGWVEATPDTHRVRLPEELNTCYVEDLNGHRFIVSASAEKGIRFHFHVDTALAVREAVLEHWYAHLRQLHQRLADGQLEADPLEISPPSAWWNAMNNVIHGLERQDNEMQSIGSILI